MGVLSSQQVRAWDEFTIQHEPIASLDLMERAAGACFEWLKKNNYLPNEFAIFCGKGNNGGDGLALARMLSSQSKVIVYILEFGHKGTDDFQANLASLHKTDAEIKFIQSEEQLPILAGKKIIVDALLGSGLNRPIDGFTASVVNHINDSGNEIVSIDIPSGLFVDKSSKGNLFVKATHTLSFQCQKPAFMVAENATAIGSVHILNIGLDPSFLQTIEPAYEWIDRKFVKKIFRPRSAFSHKGTFGHALIVAGSYGKMGAAVLCTRACLRSGAGLVTTHIPRSGLQILQVAAPEAMCDVDANDHVNESVLLDLEKFPAIGLGPGLGTDDLTTTLVENIFANRKRPMVIDADALNIVAKKRMQQKIPKGSILTPHPKEFERLFGASQNDFEIIEKAVTHARSLGVTILLKGHHTFIASPNGKGYFNSTGNPGMATGGSGDVLTGLITGLVAQNYEPTLAAILGVYWHGASADVAANHMSFESMIASDIIEHLGMVVLE
jgi:NAD(P)H-hydrate epimerase